MAQFIGDYPAHVNRQKRAAARKAFGAQRPTTPAERAQYVAESIALRQDEGRAWDWSTYGLEENLLQQRLVEAKLASLRWTKEEQERLDAWYWEQEQMRLEELAEQED